LLLIVARLRTWHAQYDFWAINILCILAVVAYLRLKWKKAELRSVMKWQFLTNSFVPLHPLLFWLRTEVVHPHFILNNELWYKFLLGHVRIIWEVLQKLVHSSGVSTSTPIWQTLCSYAEMHEIFIAPVIFCMSCLRLATIRSKYYFNFILIRIRSGRELFDRPSYNGLDLKQMLLRVMWYRETCCIVQFPCNRIAVVSDADAFSAFASFFVFFFCWHIF